MSNPHRLILASSSVTRRDLLTNAGLSPLVVPPNVDEAAIKQANFVPKSDQAHADQLALRLAHAKAASVAMRNPEALVIGADQILRCDAALFDKPEDKSAARRHLEMLSGHTHRLHTAVVIHYANQIVFEHVACPSLTMRSLSPAFLDWYCELEAENLCHSVGAYRLEGPGVQLFDRIEGDFTAILGLPMLPLLAALRALNVIMG